MYRTIQMSAAALYSLLKDVDGILPPWLTSTWSSWTPPCVASLLLRTTQKLFLLQCVHCSPSERVVAGVNSSNNVMADLNNMYCANIIATATLWQLWGHSHFRYNSYFDAHPLHIPKVAASVRSSQKVMANLTACTGPRGTVRCSLSPIRAVNTYLGLFSLKCAYRGVGWRVRIPTKFVCKSGV
jgi:hypothetical protein